MIKKNLSHGHPWIFLLKMHAYFLFSLTRLFEIFRICFVHRYQISFSETRKLIFFFCLLVNPQGVIMIHFIHKSSKIFSQSADFASSVTINCFNNLRINISFRNICIYYLSRSGIEICDFQLRIKYLKRKSTKNYQFKAFQLQI